MNLEYYYRPSNTIYAVKQEIYNKVPQS